jgi:hypothetical protein
MYSIHSFEELKESIENKNKELVFIHTPKCGGSYVSTILSHLKIKNNGHEQAMPNNKYIYFTVIRNPVERFESLLNYRLGEKNPRNDWPKHLQYVYRDTNIKLDEIISKMTDEEILNFSPYNTINYWIKNVDIIITLDNLPKMLEYFGYKYNIDLFEKINVSKKIRGKINQSNNDRITNIFNNDFEIYNIVCNSVF